MGVLGIVQTSIIWLGILVSGASFFVLLHRQLFRESADIQPPLPRWWIQIRNPLLILISGIFLTVVFDTTLHNAARNLGVNDNLVGLMNPREVVSFINLMILVAGMVFAWRLIPTFSNTGMTEKKWLFVALICTVGIWLAQRSAVDGSEQRRSEMHGYIHSLMGILFLWTYWLPSGRGLGTSFIQKLYPFAAMALVTAMVTFNMVGRWNFANLNVVMFRTVWLLGLTLLANGTLETWWKKITAQEESDGLNIRKTDTDGAINMNDTQPDESIEINEELHELLSQNPAISNVERYVALAQKSGMSQEELLQTERDEPTISTNHQHQPDLVHTSSDHIDRQVISILLPPSTKYNSNAMLQLLTNLYGIPSPLNLLIRAKRDHIAWSVEVGRNHVNSAKSTLHALYPQAEITVVPKTEIDMGYYRFQMEFSAPHIGSIPGITEFKTTDPLAVVVGAMRMLKEGESLVYELMLAPPQQNFSPIGEHMLMGSGIQLSDYMTMGGMAQANAMKAAGADKVQKYTDDIDKAARIKLKLPLKEVVMQVKVKAESRQRAGEIFELIYNGLAQYDHGLGELVPGQSQSFPLVLTADETAALWHLPNQDIQIPGVAWLTGVVSQAPAELTSPNVNGVVLGTNSFQGETKEITLPYADRITHINLIGRTRLGKSTLFHHMIRQDIQNGHGVALIDPHGDLFNEVLATCIPENRHDDVVLFDVTDTEYPVGLNLFSQPTGVDPDAAASQILNILQKIFAANWNPTRMEDVLYNGITALMYHHDATIKDIPKLLSNPQFRRQVLAKVDDPVATEFWIDEFEPSSDSYKRDTTRPINSRLRRFYRNKTIERILCQPASLDFRQIMDTRKIFLVNLGGLPDAERDTLGALLISKLQMAAMSRVGVSKEKRRPYYLYIDEVQNFATTSLPTILSEAAKYGLCLVMANQFLKQLEGGTLDAIMGNVGTTIMFGVGPDDARILEKFVAHVADGNTLIKQGRGETLVRTMFEGNALDAFSMKTLPPLAQPAISEEAITYIRTQSRQKYARHRDEVDGELQERYSDPAADNQDQDDGNQDNSSADSDNDSADGDDNVDKFAG